jgi:hypothetical protein
VNKPGIRKHCLLLEGELQMRERWIDNYYIQRDKILWSKPFLVRVIVGQLIYRKTSQTLHGQGTGRFDMEEIAMFRREIWEGISDLLESSLMHSKAKAENDKPFWILGGAQPTEADASLFGFITSVLVCAR